MGKVWRDWLKKPFEELKVVTRVGVHGYAAIAAAALFTMSLPGLDRSGLFATSTVTSELPATTVVADQEDPAVALAVPGGVAVTASAQPAAPAAPAPAEERDTASSRGGDRPAPAPAAEITTCLSLRPR